MALSHATRRLVWVKCGGCCAFPECGVRLVEKGSGGQDTFVGEVAHIVSSKPRGPRAGKPIPGGDVDGIGNLLLLCLPHHTVVDDQQATYTVERLVAIKTDHERWADQRFQRESATLAPPRELVEESPFLTVLPVERMPLHVFTAPCTETEAVVHTMLKGAATDDLMLPFIVRDKQLMTFCPLDDRAAPFASAFVGSPKTQDARTWWRDPDLYRWYVTLLNRSLNKLTGRRGLHLDQDHRRYYFPCETHSERADHALPRSIAYTPPNMATTTRQVVWQPTVRSTGEPKGYWVHLAVSLRFHLVSTKDWILSIRPEHRFTENGFDPLSPDETSKKATRFKAHMYNYKLLSDVHFWKEFLSGGTPRIAFDFGGQSLIVNARFVQGNIKWPSIPRDVRPFTNLTATDDLFTSALYFRLVDESRAKDAELELAEYVDYEILADGE